MSSAAPAPTPTTPSRCSGIQQGTPEITGDVNWIAVRGTNASVPWMTTCCDPHPVHSFAEGCWLWCEMDPDRQPSHDQARLANTYLDCFDEHGRENRSDGATWHYIPDKKDEDEGAAVGRAPSMLGLVVSMMLVGMVLVG